MHTNESGLTEFMIHYDYFGLSNMALVKKMTWGSQTYFKCFLYFTGHEVDIMHEKEEDCLSWIDLASGSATPFSQILGQAIENKLGPQQL